MRLSIVRPLGIKCAAYQATRLLFFETRFSRLCCHQPCRGYMKIRKKLIPLAFAEEGMKLGAPVNDMQGRPLMPDGAELSERSLSSLRRRNVSCISILEEDPRSEEELAIERSKMTEHINALFHKTDKTANMELLQQFILEYRLEPLL